MGWPGDLSNVDPWDVKPGPGGGESSTTADRVAFGSDWMGMGQLPGPLNGVFNIVGAFATAYSQYQQSTATTNLGRNVDAVAAGGMDLVMGAVNPLLPVIDYAVGKMFDAMGIQGISISDTENTAIRATTTLVDGLMTWDPEGMETFHNKSLNGDYGPLFQKASEAGDWLSKHVEIPPVLIDVMKPIDLEDLVAQVRHQEIMESRNPEIPFDLDVISRRLSR